MRKGEYMKVLKTIAMSEGITVEEVENEMQRAIDAGFSSQDESVQNEWSKVPFKGDRPTSKELLEYLVKCQREAD